jgi:hypothetical protein
MSMSKLITIATAVAAASMFAGTIKLAAAQQASDVIGELANNQGIFVDGNTFKIVRGAANGDPSAEIVKLGDKETGPGGNHLPTRRQDLHGRSFA